ncbi:ABC transporter substrate-binding protein [Natronosalvus rutilus]|uniref:ABC transporter substrate-binding protein n=1 Tax=Natronosalvus rutilus TaxID=2953753 RepID=A0A9E7N9C5_9EURY|nr:ABC transporter substrate-binding protein [Natronosalvus rutilus]UTF52670.1 ABC transporter substrate-binding protein [Natronosalvus rutilus]
MASHNSSPETADSSTGPSRRLFVKAAAAGVPIAFAGCLGGGGDGNGNGNGIGNGNGNQTGPDAEEGDPVEGGELLWGGSVPVQSLDPHFESAAASARVLENITQGLVRVNWDYELEPLLAEDWESSDDNLELTFTIRQGVQFHDGTELTADDVLASFTRIEENEGLAADYMALVDSMEAPDDQTFVMQLSEPFAPMLSRMATSHMHILTAEQAEQDTVNEPVGTGPFQFESMELDSEFVMTKFDDYWDDELPYLDRVTKSEISDNDNRLNTFEAGEVDFINDVPPRHAESLEGDSSIDFISRFPKSLVYLGVNCTEEPFDSRDARLALEYAIDKNEVMEAALYGQGQVAASPAAPGSEWEHPDLEPRPQDYELAQEHLDAAGYSDGFEATFQIPEQYNDQVTAAQVIESQAAEVGINLNIQLITWSNWLSDVYTDRNFQATTSSYLALWFPDAGFHRPLHSEGAFFFTGWEDEEYDSLIDEARQLYEIEERAPLYHEAAEILQERRSGHILLYWMPTLMARQPNYKGEVMSPDGSTFRFENTWME